MRTTRVLSIFFTVGLIWACSSSSTDPVKPAGDAGKDSGPPTPVGSCTPNEASTGNSQHVGAFCTKGGGECADLGTLLCAIDFDERGGAYCIKVNCNTDADCGEAACCQGDPSKSAIKACVPLQCVTDAGSCPAPVADAGTD